MRRQMTLSIIALGCMALALPSPAAAAPAKASQPRGTVVYVVRKGDTLFDLAAKFLLTADAAGIVQRLNHVTNPRRMPVGLRLAIPTRLIRREPIIARIQSFSGAVTITAGGRTLTAAQGAAVGEGSEIQTGANAFISLKLPDGTTVTIPSQTRARIGLLQLTPLTGTVDRRFDVSAGRIGATVVPMTNPRSTFKVTTPVAVSAVRGTEFRVAYDPALNRALTEVITGKVAVKTPRTSDVLVPAGYGAATQPTAGVSAPVPLLMAPVPTAQSGTQRAATLAFTVGPVAGAVAYRLQIARDAGFLDQIGEADSAGPSVALQSLPDGTYFARVSALDAAGLEGRSTIFGFHRRLHGVTTSMDQRTTGDRRDYLFQWQSQGAGTYVYRFQLARCGDERRPVVDQENLTNFGLTVTDLPNGTYCWRVQSVEVGEVAGDVIWSDPKTFTIVR